MCIQSHIDRAVPTGNLCVQSQVEQWKRKNACRLIDCRWGLKITTQACRSYQTRCARYVLHFNGDRNPSPRVNADYLCCLLPDPCPHLLPDSEVETLAESRHSDERNGNRSIRPPCGPAVDGKKKIPPYPPLVKGGPRGHLGRVGEGVVQDAHADRLMARTKAKTLDRLVNPDRMLNEPDRYRSLVKG